MNDNELLRYSRHIMLSQIDIEGQEQLKHSTVLVIGAGGLGCPALQYLASSGIGHIIIVDGDHIELTNLQRQILYRIEDIGKSKAESAKRNLLQMNAEIQITAISQHLDESLFLNLIDKYQIDVMLDCTDNFKARYLINRLGVQFKIPLVSGAGIGFDGQLMVFNFKQEHITSCYECLFPQSDSEDEALRCATNGVFAPLVGLIGVAQASEALKLLLNIDHSLHFKLVLFDAIHFQWRTIPISGDSDCIICQKI